MRRYAIITYTRREDGDSGGVPRWAWYLKRALDEARHEVEHFAWADYPNRADLATAPEQVRALALSSWVGAQAADYAGIIADGFWGWGLPETARAIICAHGTWAGLDAAMGGVPRDFVEAQHETFRRFPVIAVSEAAAHEVFVHHQVRAAGVVPNGVDLDLYQPDGHARGRRIRHASHSTSKGRDIVERVAAQLDAGARVEYLEAAIGNEPPRFAAADVFLHPSRYEGDSYACIEALACGVPLVHSITGRWASEPEDSRVGRGLDIGAATGEWVAAVEALLTDPEAPARARAYAEERADYRDFARRWLKAVSTL